MESRAARPVESISVRPTTWNADCRITTRGECFQPSAILPGWSARFRRSQHGKRLGGGSSKSRSHWEDASDGSETMPCRSIVSVGATRRRAEGFERVHLQEKLQFYNVARGSTGEVRSLLYVIEDSFPVCAETAVQLREQTAATGRLVTGLIQSTERRRPGK